MSLELTGRPKVAAVDTLRDAIQSMTGQLPGYAVTEDALDRALAAGAAAGAAAAARESGAVDGPDGARS